MTRHTMKTEPKMRRKEENLDHKDGGYIHKTRQDK